MSLCVVVLSLFFVSACGGAQQQAVSYSPGWYEVTFTSAALPARRASGASWHTGPGDNSSAVLFGLLGLAVGFPVEGFALGSAMTTEPSPEAPAPYVVVKIAGDTYRISPVGQTLSPTWQQPIAIPSQRYPPSTPALIQVLDAIDQGLLGQLETTAGELLTPGHRTLTGIGEVASLDVTVHARPTRLPLEYELRVDPRRSLDELVNGADPDWIPIPVWNGDRVAVRAEGKVCPSRPEPCFGPEGAPPPRWQSYNYDGFKDSPHAALVGLLPGQPLQLGPGASFIAEEAGFLLLFVNDTDEGNNDGYLAVVVSVEPPGR